MIATSDVVGARLEARTLQERAQVEAVIVGRVVLGVVRRRQSRHLVARDCVVEEEVLHLQSDAIVTSSSCHLVSRWIVALRAFCATASSWPSGWTFARIDGVSVRPFHRSTSVRYIDRGPQCSTLRHVPRSASSA